MNDAPSSTNVKPLSEDGERRLRGARLALAAIHAAKPADDIEVELDELVAEFDGDLRAALRAFLSDFRTIVRDYESTISSGYARRIK